MIYRCFLVRVHLLPHLICSYLVFALVALIMARDRSTQTDSLRYRAAALCCRQNRSGRDPVQG
jgi:hypothetical protein